MHLNQQTILLFASFAVSSWGFLITANADLVYVNEVLADKPAGYWRLEETSGTTATDSSGNGRHGVYSGNVNLGSVGSLAGGTNYAATFDGFSAEVLLPGTWGGEPAFTYEAIVNNSFLTGNFQAILSSSTEQFVHFQTFNVGVNRIYTDAGSVDLPIIPEMPFDEWRHVVLVAESGNSRLYVDGIQVGQSNGTTFGNVTSSSDVRIGNGFGASRWFAGQLDEVAIYDYALSESRIVAHFNAISVPGDKTQLGDMNCDGVVNLLDVAPFILAISDPVGYEAAYPDCDINLADCNEDGAINLLDVDPFIAILTGG